MTKQNLEKEDKWGWYSFLLFGFLFKDLIDNVLHFLTNITTRKMTCGF